MNDNPDINKTLFEHFVRFLQKINKTHYAFEEEYRIVDNWGITMIVFDERPKYYSSRLGSPRYIDLHNPNSIKIVEDALREYRYDY